MYDILLPIGRAEADARRQAEMVVEMPIDPANLSTTVLYAAEKIESEVGGTVSSVHTEELPDSIHTAIDVLEDDGLDVEVVVAEGGLADSVDSLVDERDIDHVVVAGQRRTPTGKALFGSEVQSIVLNAPVPVTVTPEPDEG